MANTRKSVVFLSAATLVSLSVQLVLVVVVARWLQPVEIGAFAVAYAAILILDQMRQFKLVTYVIQAAEVDAPLMGVVQFVGLTTTLAAVAIGVVASLVMQQGFATPTAGSLLLVMCAMFPVKWLAQTSLCQLSRDMQFGLIASVRVAGALLKAAVAIGLLIYGFGPEALAIGIVAEVVPELWLLAKADRKLALARPRWGGSRPVWIFCSKASAAQFINISTGSATDLFIGIFFGLTAAGYFNRANVLVKQLQAGLEKAIFPVAVAVFAKANRQDQAALGKAYLQGIAFLTGFTWPALLVLLVMTELIVSVVFGSRWLQIVPVAQVLSVAGLIFSATALSPTLLSSIGAVNALLKRELWIQVPRLLILAVALQFDILAVAVGMVVSQAIVFFVNEHLVSHAVGFTMRAHLRTLVPSAALAVITAGCAWSVVQWGGAVLSELLRLVMALGAAGIGWLVGVLLFHVPLRSELANLKARLFMKKARERVS